MRFPITDQVEFLPSRRFYEPADRCAHAGANSTYQHTVETRSKVIKDTIVSTQISDNEAAAESRESPAWRPATGSPAPGSGRARSQRARPDPESCYPVVTRGGGVHPKPPEPPANDSYGCVRRRGGRASPDHTPRFKYRC